MTGFHLPPTTRFLRSGELFLSRRGDDPVRVMTVLGSCVSVTLFEPRFGFAAMCHAVMPRCPGESDCFGIRCPKPFRYARCAVSGMVERFREAGIDLKTVEAKLFGGADMFDSAGSAHPVPGVGRMNVETAEAVLRESGIRLKSCDAGGLNGRKILFSPLTGEVWIKTVQSNFTGMH